jgi:hypothetical protein
MVKKKYNRGSVRSSSFSDRNKRESATYIINMISSLPDNNPFMMKAKRYLMIMYGLPEDEIGMRIHSARLKRERLGDFQSYLKGEKSAEDVAGKWRAQGYSPDEVVRAVHAINRYEIPKGQKPIITSGPTYSEAWALLQQVKRGERPESDFVRYLIDLAHRRPEFAMNVATTLGYARKTANGTFRFPRGEPGAQQRKAFLDILTEYYVALKRESPRRKPLTRDDMERKREFITGMKRSEADYSNVKYPRDLFDEPVERKKKASRKSSPRRKRKVHKVKKRRVCKCRVR